MNLKQSLIQRILKRNMVVGVIGLGYVGLPLAVEKAKAGFLTIGFDVQDEKVQMVNQGINYIGDVVDSELSALVSAHRLSATNDFSQLMQADFIAICVPTPLDTHWQPDLSYLQRSAEMIGQYLRAGMTVVLESTTYPGTTEEMICPILEQRSGLHCGEEFYLGFSPERVDPGNKLYKTVNTPKIVGCIGNDATEIIRTMYQEVLSSEVLAVSSPKAAEMEKILENTYRNINIALANEMAVICHKMGINIWEVINAAKTKPYGFQAFYPGAGVGGHCIPLDPYYLSWKAKEFDYHTRLIQTAGEINSNMPAYIVERCANLLNRSGAALQGAKLLVLGVAYKQDINDYRESPAVKVIAALEELGALTDYYDPYISSYHFKDIQKYSVPILDSNLLRQYDLCIITTAHSCIDYQLVVNHAAMIFDCKNVTAPFQPAKNIEVL